VRRARDAHAADARRGAAQGLAEELAALAGAGDAPPLRTAVAALLDGMSPMDWLKPPMLSKKK
jgi:hypothetical protein